MLKPKFVKVSIDEQECKKVIRGLVLDLGLHGKIKSSPHSSREEINHTADHIFEVVQAGFSHNPTAEFIPHTVDGIQLAFVLDRNPKQKSSA